jgi:hypothetical protein
MIATTIIAANTITVPTLSAMKTAVTGAPG